MTVGDEDSEAVVVSRTYINQDAQGRETHRRTFMVNANGDTTTTVLRMVTTEYPGADDTVPVTTVTTCVPDCDHDVGTTERVEVEMTNADGEVTTTVRLGPPSADLFTTMVATPADDGSTTVVTTYGPAYTAANGGDDDLVGDSQSVRTNADDTKVTTTFMGMGDDAMATRRVTTDETGAETMRVTITNSGNTEARVAIAYLRDGRSTETTTTWTRTDADEALAQTGNTVVVSNDAMGREVLSVTTDSDGEETDRRVTVYAADGSSTATRERYEHVYEEDADGNPTTTIATRDMVKNVEIVRRAAPGMGETVGAITDDIVIHPGPQTHDMVSDMQYDAIQTGLTPQENSKTLMGQAILHLDYDDDDAFRDFTTVSGAGTNLELEVVTESPVCAANGNCTYSRLRGGYPLAPAWTEMRLYNTADSMVLINTDIRDQTLTNLNNANFWASISDNNDPDNPRGSGTPNPVFAWLNNDSRVAAQGVLLELLSDLLGIGGAGLSAEYTANTAASGAAPNYRFVAEAASTADAVDRSTYTYLETAETGVLGIGRQVKEIDSYLRLGGTRDADEDPATDDPMPVRIQVENYFGWMANSMFTVRRVTAGNVDGYDWKLGTFEADAAERARAYVGMVSGDPSNRPDERRAAGMADPGTWSGSMIGVGTVHGERYKGDALVTVDFAANDVTTQFKQVRLDRDGLSDADFSRYYRGLNPELIDATGITFTSTRIEGDGSYTSDILTGAGTGAAVEPLPRDAGSAEMTRRFSSLSAQFYGPDAAEVAGTFNAFELAVGRRVDGDGDLTVERGDIVGAFGATRDPMTETESDN